MQSHTSVLRRESFGGTLNNAVSGKRIYIDTAEYDLIKKLGKIPTNLQNEIKSKSGEVFITEPKILFDYNFSAPDTVFFEITRACNLLCTHCFNDSGNRLSHELSDNERDRAIESICESGVQEIRFTGGEPLVVSAVFGYITKIRELGLRASIGTNGVLINKQVAKRLAIAGLNIAITSIDGIQEKHDLIRGKGSFQKTLAGIQALLDEGISVRVNVVVMKSNMDEIPVIVEYFYNRNIPIVIRRLIPSGRADIMKDEMLTSIDYQLLRDRLHHFISDERGLVKGHYLKDEDFITRIKLPFDRMSCSAGHRGLVILPDGNIQTCGFLGPLGESSLGNLRNDSLTGIWQRLLESRHIQDLRSNLPGYNKYTSGPKTNCLAIALASSNNLIQIQRGEM